jgi:hypothetical protein
MADPVTRSIPQQRYRRRDPSAMLARRDNFSLRRARSRNNEIAAARAAAIFGAMQHTPDL